MNQEYVSKSACKGCEHLEYVGGALLSESEYACKASVLDTIPAGCKPDGWLSEAVKEIEAEGNFTPYTRQTPRSKQQARRINLEITSCRQCPYILIDTRKGMAKCGKTHDALCASTPVALAKLQIPDSCPLEFL